MILFFIFLFLGIYFCWLYIFSSDKFSPANLMMAVWLIAISVSQLRLSSYEKIWTLYFWLILSLFLILFYLVFKIINRKIGCKMKVSSNVFSINKILFTVLVTIFTLASLIINFYIYFYFGTMPIFSTSPDKMRFIINRDIFGLWEYLALLPRLYIPFIFFYLWSAKEISLRYKIFLWSNVLLGFALLFLYASRLVIILPIILSYFVYLYLQKSNINFKKIIRSSILIILLVAVISVSMPAFRNYITYRDYYDDSNYTPFTYLVDLSSVNLPSNLNWAVPLYIIPSFNLQAMLQATTFYNPSVNNYYYGQYHLSVVSPFLKILNMAPADITVPWESIFLSWWITATFLFSAWADFGYLGIMLMSLFWGIILAVLYQYATKKPTYLSIMLLSYLNFVVVMSIYTDYLMRAEFYLDILFIFIVSFFIKNK